MSFLFYSEDLSFQFTWVLILREYPRFLPKLTKQVSWYTLVIYSASSKFSTSGWLASSQGTNNHWYSPNQLEYDAECSYSQLDPLPDWIGPAFSIKMQFNQDTGTMITRSRREIFHRLSTFELLIFTYCTVILLKVETFSSHFKIFHQLFQCHLIDQLICNI
jgi:hypothetical protein